MKELMQWYNQISSFPKLKLAEAQELYQKAINTEDENLKKVYMDKLILGTLYVVCEYIKRNGLELFVSSSYDMNDIISSFNAVWIKKIYNGDLLKVDRYSLLFTSPYYNEVYNNLFGDEIIVNEQFKVSIDCFVELLTTYVLYRNKEINKPFREVIEETYFNDRWNSWSYFIYDDVKKLIPLLEKIYRNLNFDKLEDLNLGKTKIADYLRLIINIGLIEPISNELPDNTDMEDSITTNMVMEAFIHDVDNAITNERERQIIHERYGLDNGIPLFLSDIGKIHNLSKDRVRQIEAKALRKLRCRRDFFKKYEGENI